MNSAVAGTNWWFVDTEFRAVIIGDHAARLLDQEFARGDVPRIQPFFPEAIKPATGDVSHVDRCRTVAANSTRAEHKLGQMPGEILTMLEIVWKAGDNKCLAKFFGGGNADGLAVQRGTISLFSSK